MDDPLLLLEGRVMVSSPWPVGSLYVSVTVGESRCSSSSSLVM